MFYSTDVIYDARQFLKDFTAPYRFTDLMLNGWMMDALREIYKSRPDCQIDANGNRSVIQEIPLTGFYSYALTGGHDGYTSKFEQITGWNRILHPTLYLKYEGGTPVINIYYSTASRSAGTSKIASFAGTVGLNPLTTIDTTIYAPDALAISGFVSVDFAPTLNNTWEVTAALKPMIISDYFRCAMGHFITSRAFLMDSNDTANQNLAVFHLKTFTSELTGK